MRFIVLIVTVIGIATPASSSSHDEEEEMILLRAIVRIDSLLTQGQSDQVFDEFREFKTSFLGYLQGRIGAKLHNGHARFLLSRPGGPSLGEYPKAAEPLQKSLALNPTQRSLFEILEMVILENIELYDNTAFLLDKIGLSAEAHEYREQVKDRRSFAEGLTAALEPLRKKSLEETMERFPALRK